MFRVGNRPDPNSPCELLDRRCWSRDVAFPQSEVPHWPQLLAPLPFNIQLYLGKYTLTVWKPVLKTTWYNGKCVPTLANLLNENVTVFR